MSFSLLTSWSSGWGYLHTYVWLQEEWTRFMHIQRFQLKLHLPTLTCSPFTTTWWHQHAYSPLRSQVPGLQQGSGLTAVTQTPNPFDSLYTQMKLLMWECRCSKLWQLLDHVFLFTLSWEHWKHEWQLFSQHQNTFWHMGSWYYSTTILLSFTDCNIRA